MLEGHFNDDGTSLNLTLDVCGNKTIKNPSEEDIRKAVSSLDPCQNDAFLILAKSQKTYIQIWANEKNSFGIEYQVKDTAHHYRCRTMFTAEAIAAVMTSYLQGKPEWKANYEWEDIGVPTGSAIAADNDQMKTVQDISRSVTWMFSLSIIFVLMIITARWYAADGNVLAVNIFQILRHGVILLLAAVFLDLRVLSDPSKLEINKARFIKVLAFCTAGYLLILEIIQRYPSSKIAFNKVGLLVVAFGIIWETKICLQIGNISGRGGFVIYRKKSPVLFWVGIVFYLICATLLGIGAFK